MTPLQYQEAAKRTLVTTKLEDTIAMCGLGIAGEAGEVNELVKKRFHGKELDPLKMKDELSDVVWYISNLADALGIYLDTIMPSYKPVQSLNLLALQLASYAGKVASDVYGFMVFPGIGITDFVTSVGIAHDLSMVLTYVQAIAGCVGTDLPQIFIHNIDKLTRRHAGVRFNWDYESDSTPPQKKYCGYCGDEDDGTFIWIKETKSWQCVMCQNGR